MQEAMDVGKFPYVVLKAVSQLGGAVAASTATKTVTLDLTGELELHGVRRPVSMPVTLEMKADGTARAHGSFDVSLDAHQIERPSLLFVKVDDACRIEFDISFRGGKT
jgi:polyisoprenoid-binding protein YceI